MYCPQCGRPAFNSTNEKLWQCSDCEFTYFHNIAAAVAAIICFDGQILFMRRAHEPGAGKLGLPGGFVDVGESAEQALIREIYEEVGLKIESPGQYVGSWTNRYHFRDVLYHTMDSYFFWQLDSRPALQALDGEASEICWLPMTAINWADVAFCSAEQALRHWLAVQGVTPIHDNTDGLHYRPA